MSTPLTEVLDLMTQTLEQLRECQHHELTAVVEREHARVAELTDIKATLLEQLQEYDAFIAQHPDKSLLQSDDELAAQMRIINDLLARVKQQSDVNEQVVNRTLSNIEQLKQTIIRHASQARGDTVTYDSKGRIR